MNQFRIREISPGAKAAGLSVDDGWRLIEAFGSDEAKDLAAEVREGLQEIKTRESELAAEAKRLVSERLALDSLSRQLADERAALDRRVASVNADAAFIAERMASVEESASYVDELLTGQWEEHRVKFEAFRAELAKRGKASAGTAGQAA